MNTKITRRAALGALAATAALPGASFASAVTDYPAPSRLAELIAEYRQVREVTDNIVDRIIEIENSLDLPPVRVSGGRVVGGSDIWLVTPDDIDRHFDRLCCLTFPEHARAAANVRRAKAHTELSELAARVHRTREENGLNAAEAEYEAAQDRHMDAREAIFAYVPQTLEEYRARDAFLMEHIDANNDLDEHHLRAIFSA